MVNNLEISIWRNWWFIERVEGGDMIPLWRGHCRQLGWLRSKLCDVGQMGRLRMNETYLWNWQWSNCFEMNWIDLHRKRSPLGARMQISSPSSRCQRTTGWGSPVKWNSNNQIDDWIADRKTKITGRWYRLTVQLYRYRFNCCSYFKPLMVVIINGFLILTAF